MIVYSHIQIFAGKQMYTFAISISVFTYAGPHMWKSYLEFLCPVWTTITQNWVIYKQKKFIFHNFED